MPMNISELPRTAVQQWLGVLRLPLTAVTRFTGHSEDETWPPAVAFDAFEAQVEGFVGTVLHNEKLQEAAEQGRQRVARLRDAVALETAADEKRAAAESELEERRQAAKERALQAEDRADSAQERLEEQEAAAKRQVRDTAAARKQEADRVAETAQQRIDEQAKRAEQKRLKEERDALAERRKALKAKTRAVELDKATTATRQRRKARP